MLFEEVDQLLAEQRALSVKVDEVISKLKDISIPVADRWLAFTKLTENKLFVNYELYGDGFIDTLGSNLTLYDDFYYERCETVEYTSMFEHLMEADGEYQKKLVEARENNLDAWREAVLASGYSGFKYDW